ncbi:Lipoprotein, putative [hydrothermal vent metagenome]|uniref:Lipoprotein, putative n=1 Tax=hydrothermal vent metagenome TaxID=652676 RepID=A0A3B0RS86_9ZZZZ
MQQAGRIFVVTFLLLLQTGCAARGMLTPVALAVPQASVQKIFIASARKFDNDQAVYFSDKRSNNLLYARLDVSVPLKRPEGEIQWASETANPAREFAIVGEQKIPGNGDLFRADLNRDLTTKASGDKAIFIFIHGYNNTFAESLYRLAQLKHDSDIEAVTVGFVWPSRAQLTGYIYDRDSVAVARDQLQKLFELTAQAKTDRIYVMAHSLGTWLTMETLRQMRIGNTRKSKKFFKKLKALALAAPDIDEDVFKSQLSRLGKLNVPFYVLRSERDQVLAFLGRFTGDVQRVGRITDTSGLTKTYGITFPSLTNEEGGDTLGHSTFATSPTFLALFREWVHRASGKPARAN